MSIKFVIYILEIAVILLLMFLILSFDVRVLSCLVFKCVVGEYITDDYTQDTQDTKTSPSFVRAEEVTYTHTHTHANRFLPFILPRRSVNYSPVFHRASLSGTFLQTLPDLVTSLKEHSLSPRSCPATRSAPTENFGY